MKEMLLNNENDPDILSTVNSISISYDRIGDKSKSIEY